MEMSSFWWNFRYWLYRKLSFDNVGAASDENSVKTTCILRCQSFSSNADDKQVSLKKKHEMHEIVQNKCVICHSEKTSHDDVIKWKHYQRYWPFVWGIPPTKTSDGGFDVFFCAWINGWVNNRKAGDLRCHRAHYDVSVMCLFDTVTNMLTGGNFPVAKISIITYKMRIDFHIYIYVAFL